MAALPREITQGSRELKIAWEGGSESVYPAALLRRHCPCALCRDEWTGRSTLDPASVPEDLAILKAELVGQYAVAIQFSDGHSTGIYSFENLRKGLAS